MPRASGQALISIPALKLWPTNVKNKNFEVPRSIPYLPTAVKTVKGENSLRAYFTVLKFVIKLFPDSAINRDYPGWGRTEEKITIPVQRLGRSVVVIVLIQTFSN